MTRLTAKDLAILVEQANRYLHSKDSIHLPFSARVDLTTAINRATFDLEAIPVEIEGAA